MRAPVVRVGAALDQAGGVELVDQAGERDRRDIERLGELALLIALTALEPRQNRPLRARRAELAGAMVRIGSEQPCGVMEGESDLPPAREDPFISN